MTDNLYLRYHADGVEWLLLDAAKPAAQDAVRARGRGSLANLVDSLATLNWQGAVRVLQPVEDVLLTQARVPSRQARQIAQAVPFAVEEQLAVDVETCHFALGERVGDDISVAVIDQQRFETQLDSLAEAGISPRHWVIDALQLPVDDGPCVLIDGERVLVRTRQTAAYGFCRDQMALGLGLLAQNMKGDSQNTEETPPAPMDSLQVRVASDDINGLALILDQLNAEFGLASEVVELPMSAFEFLCRQASDNSLDLLQGPYRVEPVRSGSLGVWRSAALLAVCALGLQLGLQSAQGLYLGQQANTYEAEAEALYADVFPQDRNVRDLKRRWQSHLSSGGGAADADFMVLFQQAATQLPGARLQLSNINYNASRGDLILQIQAPRSEQLVQFARTLTDAGLKAEIGTISQDGDQSRGSIKIQGRAGT